MESSGSEQMQVEIRRLREETRVLKSEMAGRDILKGQSSRGRTLEGLSIRQRESVDEQEKEATPGGNETILVVDDEPHVSEVIKEILRKFGYKVTTAGSGEEAIRKYSNTGADLVILDVGMPGMGGAGCLQELLSIDQTARVIISSGNSVDERVQMALKRGAAAFLAKPYPIDELLQTVREVLDLNESC